MRKFLSITLAIFVLCATVCVFFPTSTASAAEYYYPDYSFFSTSLPSVYALHDFHGFTADGDMIDAYYEQWNGISWIKLGSLVSSYDDFDLPDSFKISFEFRNQLTNFALLFYVIEPFTVYENSPGFIDCDSHFKTTDSNTFSDYVNVAENLLFYSNYYYFENTVGKFVNEVELLFHAYNDFNFFPEFFDNIYVAFVSMSDARASGALPSVCQNYAFYRAYNNVYTQSESYLTGVVDGKNEAFSMLDSFPLTTRENIKQVVLGGIAEDGSDVRVGHWDVDYNYQYSGLQYFQLSNITPVSDVSRIVVKLIFDQSYVPVSIRTNYGYNSFSNGTGSVITSLSYYGNQLYGTDITSLSQSNYVELVFPYTVNSSIFFRIMGSSYGSTLDKAYNNGVEDGKLLADKSAYNKGYSDGVNASNKFTFFNLISSIIDVPINAILSLFNLEIFGFNLAPMLTAILSLCIVFTIIKMVL